MLSKDFKQVRYLSRFEIRNEFLEEATLYTRNPTVYITDSSIGVQYAIDKTMGNCTIRGVKSFKYDSVLPDKYNTALDFITKILSTMSFLRPNETYIYTGQKRANGILSDQYMSKINSDIYEYAFSSDDYLITSDSSVEQNVPVNLFIDSAQPGYGSRSNFFNFNKSPPNPSQFDISRCFVAQDILNVEIIYPFKGSEKF